MVASVTQNLKRAPLVMAPLSLPPDAPTLTRNLLAPQEKWPCQAGPAALAWERSLLQNVQSYTDSEEN